jgi:hypothetical protein
MRASKQALAVIFALSHPSTELRTSSKQREKKAKALPLQG